MKKFLLLIFIFNGLSLITFSQPDPSQFMPLQVGNKWVYKDYYVHVDSSYIVSQIVSDTLINTKHYFKCINFMGENSIIYMRYDSSRGMLISLNTIGNCAENDLFQLNANIGDSSINICRQYTYKCRNIMDTTLFGINSVLKDYYNSVIDKHAQNVDQYDFLYGIGCNYKYHGGFGHSSLELKNFLRGAIINGILYGDTTTSDFHTITGLVKYRDNNQHVSSGYVKAFKHSSIGDIIVEDSVVIQSDGSYTIHIPHDTTDLMAFQNDETTSFNFVPTYYPSSITWQNAGHIYTDTNMTGIDISVYRITNDGLSHRKISGGVFKYTDQPLTGIGNAVIYAKLGNVYKGYGISNSNGAYISDSLPNGFYQLICNRMGYPTRTRYVYLNNTNLTDINFYFGSPLTGIPEGNEIPTVYSLSQNYPNPFNPATTFKFSLPNVAQTKLVIYDLLGREVSVLVNTQLNAGNYKVDWDASNYSTGVYFYRIESGSFTDVKKLVLMK